MGAKGSSSAKKTKRKKKEVRSCVRFLLSPHSLPDSTCQQQQQQQHTLFFLSLSLAASLFSIEIGCPFLFSDFLLLLLTCTVALDPEMKFKRHFLSIVLATFEGRRLFLSEKKNKTIKEMRVSQFCARWQSPFLLSDSLIRERIQWRPLKEHTVV